MSEKTEEPTEKKLEDSRKKGQSPKSQDLVFCAVLGATYLVLLGLGPSWADKLKGVVAIALNPKSAATTEIAVLSALQMMRIGAVTMAPMILVAVVVPAIALAGQVGLRLTLDAVQMKFEKVDPAQGFKRIFTTRSIIELVKAIAKALILVGVIYLLIMQVLPAVIGSAYLRIGGAAEIAWTSMTHLVGAAFGVFIVLGPLDFAIQRWLFHKENRMSKDDIKREYKDAEGDPYLKGHLANLRHELLNSAGEQHVANAAVVITNPTHYAVALRYEPGSCDVPVLVAKGMDDAAARIRALARTHGVPIVSDPPLARSLHALPIDTTIPESLFGAVAAALAWVAQINAGESRKPIQ